MFASFATVGVIGFGSVLSGLPSISVSGSPTVIVKVAVIQISVIVSCGKPESSISLHTWYTIVTIIPASPTVGVYVISPVSGSIATVPIAVPVPVSVKVVFPTLLGSVSPK